MKEKMAETLRMHTLLSDSIIETVVGVLCANGYCNKSDTAREILNPLSEEIDKEALSCHDEKDELLFKHGDNTATAYLYGKTHAFRGVRNYLNALEKKYMEDNL